MPIAKKRSTIPEGSFEAVLVMVIDAGTHPYNNQKEKTVEKRHWVYLVWEIPACLTSEGKPALKSRKYNLTISKKAKLREHIEGMLGSALSQKQFEIKNLLGTTALIQVQRVEGYEGPSITNVMKIPGDKQIKPFHELVGFDIDDSEIPESVSPWIRDMIEQSEEWQGERKIDGENGEVESQDEPHEETMPDFEIIPEKKTELEPF